MAIKSKVVGKITYWKDTSTTPPTQWATDSSGATKYGTAPEGWVHPTIKTNLPKAAKPGTPAKPRQLSENDLYRAITEAGRITPTGEISDNPFDSVEAWKKHLTDAGIKDPTLNSAETQSQIYDRADPYWRAYMWGSFGDTAKGGSRDTFSQWKPLKGETQEAYKARMQKAGYTPEKIEAETAALKDKFVDAKSGVREAFLSTKIPVRKEPVPEVPVVEEEKKVPDYVPPYVGQRRDAPFWLQDIINVGAATANRLGLKKYLPWAPKYEPRVPEPTFYDPTRELAANAEAMAIGTRGAAAFAGPQAYGARFSKIQGAGAKNAADILARYHGRNVGVANQFENIKANIYNQADQVNAKSAQRLYDQTTVANQQYDNSKRKAFDEMRGTVVNALTNRAMAQTMNYMYPHYQIDPSSGGFTYGYRGSDMIPAPQRDDLQGMAQAFSDNPIIAQYAPEVITQKYGYNPKSKRRGAFGPEGDAFLNQYTGVQQGFRRHGGETSVEDEWMNKYLGEFVSTFRD